jgi:hypothetical protein
VTRALLERVVSPPELGPGRGPPGGWGRRVLIGLALAFWLVVVVVGLIGLSGDRRGQASQAPAPARGRTPGSSQPAINSPAGSGLAWHAPATVAPGPSAAQAEYDQTFSETLGSLPGMTSAEGLAVPVPAVTGGWPRLPIEMTPERWAAAFVAGLLNIDYARQSRSGLAAWLQAQEAPELLPGVPGSAADKVLYVSLLDPGLFGGQPSPVAPSAQWTAAAREGARQTVSDVIVQPDSSWAQMMAAGWQPADVRMTEEDVSGLVTVHRGGREMAHRFGLEVIVGSARWHDGYGTVAVSGWQER